MPDPIDSHNSSDAQRASRLRSRWLITIALFHAAGVSANCPKPLGLDSSETPAISEFDPNTPIDIDSDSVEATRSGEMLLKGEVTIQQGERTMKTRDAIYNQTTNEFTVENGVDYRDPNLQIRGTGAHLDPSGGATFQGADFELPTIAARGSADRINATSAGEFELDQVRYTTCPIGNEDWLLTAGEIDISQQRGIGTGRNVRLDFKGIPIMYVPYFTFPVGNERKSGFLYPSFGAYSPNGFSVPWYWNIAPNADATLIPTLDLERGAKIDTEWRYLWPFAEGTLETQYLPDDQQFGDDRSFVRLINQSDFTDSLRLDIDAANVSDDQWFEDFGQGPAGTSVTYLNRSAQLSYLTEHWLVFARTQNFQTIDDERIAESDRPYTVVPQIGVRGWLPDQPYGLTFGLDGELANFTHTIDEPSILETGARLDVAPQVRMPLRTAGLYIEPAAAWRYTKYDLEDTLEGRSDSRSRSAPIVSVDGGLNFERTTGSRAQRLQTLEPRFMYLYVPYRNQDDLPVFDTNAADLNLVQLFRTNRYVGGDRLSDANQLSFGVTSRLLDSENGRQFVSGTIGQAYYFRRPRVTLPNEPLDDTESSDIIGELDLTAYQNWNIHMGVQWDPGETRSERGDIQLQYRPNYDRVINVGYRFRRGIVELTDDVSSPTDPTTSSRGNLEQIDSSIAWPIGEQWGAFARVVYSLEDEKALDQFAGLEYRSCCWRLRVVGQRYVRNREGDMDTRIMLQLELNGLSSVGTGADTFLERTIQGYSARPPVTRQAPERSTKPPGN
jgi:LPS-assembly protein